jgi:hypothetical protein
MHPHPGAFFFAPTPFPWRHWVRVLPEAAALCPRFSLRLPIARLDSSRGFRQVTGVCPSEPLSEQLKTGVKSVDVDDRDCAPVAINRVRMELDVFTEYQLAQGLFGSLTERLAFLRCIDKCNTDPDLFWRRLAL